MESQGFVGNGEFGVWEVLWSDGELAKHQVSLPLSLPALGRDAGIGFSKSWRVFGFPDGWGKIQAPSASKSQQFIGRRPWEGREIQPLEQRGIWGCFPQISLL